MKAFLQFYRWGINVKFRMSLYTVAVIVFAGVAALAWGDGRISVWHMLQMMLLSFAMGIVECGVFPADRELEAGALVRRTVLWALCANVLYIGGALVFGWFSGAPNWYAVVLVAVLELGLFAMWFGLHIALRAETRQLNDRLKQYQKP